MTNELPLEYKYARVLGSLLYTLDCTLATVDDLCMKRSPAVSELRRQISIAQKMLDIFTEIGYQIQHQDGRICKVVLDHNRSVQKYAENLRSKWHPDKPVKL